MQKAFLCHSSKDKPYVEIVARRLGRAKVHFDSFSFQPGQDFRESITKSLDETNLFVFFVSRDSVESSWCRFELDEAHLRRMAGGIEAQLSIIIDPNVTFSDLPRWLQKLKTIIQTRPTQATRDIQYALLSLAQPLHAKPFVGRELLQRNLAESLAALDAGLRKIIVVSGLEGIGRRTYLERVLASTLGLNLGPFVLIDDTRGLDDIYLWALDETAELLTRDNLSSELTHFRQLGANDQVHEILARLRIMCADRSVPCFIDRGGMLDNLGGYRPEYAALLEGFAATDDPHFVALVHRRSPHLGGIECRDSMILQDVRPLERHEVKLLFQQLLGRSRIPVTSKLIEDITPFLGGYPPAAYFAAAHAEKYGLGTLAGDKSVLVDFKARKFTRFINDLALPETAWILLRYLASELLLPLPALAVALNVSSEEVAATLRGLIDLCLVVVIDDNCSISPPLRDAVHRVKGFLDDEFYAPARDRLTEAFWSDGQTAPSVEVVDATLHAVARSGAKDFRPYEDLIRTSSVQGMAQESYYRRKWEEAVEYASRAEKMDPTRPGARAIHFKAVVQLERWEAAEAKLADILKKGDRGAFYLQGFMLRKRRRYDDAIRSFEKAAEYGEKSFPLYRDWADCLHRVGRYDEALQKIKWVLDRDAENIFIIDLFIRICIDAGFVREAEAKISDLERYDVDERFIHHRKARLLAAKGQLERALAEAEAACRSQYAPFEAFAQKADILVELRRFPEATADVNELERRFRSQRKDVQLGLRCKLLLRQGRWPEAKAVWDQLQEKTAPVHLRLLQRILEAKGGDKSVLAAERQSAATEARGLEESISEKQPVYDDIEDETAGESEIDQEVETS